MIEHAANAKMQAGFARAHVERAQVLRLALSWIFSRRRLPVAGHRVSRWA